jgi:hypothetical protein
MRLAESLWAVTLLGLVTYTASTTPYTFLQASAPLLSPLSLPAANADVYAQPTRWPANGKRVRAFETRGCCLSAIEQQQAGVAVPHVASCHM